MAQEDSKMTMVRARNVMDLVSTVIQQTKVSAGESVRNSRSLNYLLLLPVLRLLVLPPLT